jgi:sortase A
VRRLIRDISSVLIISGLLLVVDAGVTLIWQEPVTAVVAMIKRNQIDKRFLSYHSAPLSPLDAHALGALHTMDQRISFLARREQRQVSTGAAIGKIVIKKIGASFDIVQGTDTSSLEKGPGH